MEYKENMRSLLITKVAEEDSYKGPLKKMKMIIIQKNHSSYNGNETVLAMFY